MKGPGRRNRRGSGPCKHPGAEPGSEPRPGGDGTGTSPSPVPLYVVTGGRSGAEAPSGSPLAAAPSSRPFNLVTLIVARSNPEPGMPPEHAAIVRLCRRPLSMAELSAHLALPFSAVCVLVADLLARAHVEVRAVRESPAEERQAAPEPDIEILKALIDGLQRL